MMTLIYTANSYFLSYWCLIVFVVFLCFVHISLLCVHWKIYLSTCCWQTFSYSAKIT